MFVFLLAGKSVSLSESERKYEFTYIVAAITLVQTNFIVLQNRTLSITYPEVLLFYFNQNAIKNKDVL
jgi:hypothetical protein